MIALRLRPGARLYVAIACTCSQVDYRVSRRCRPPRGAILHVGRYRPTTLCWRALADAVLDHAEEHREKAP